jgi:hypothetical protein
MKWLEIISLRGSGDVRELLDPELRGLLNQIGRLNGLIEVKLYFHAFLNNDLSIHLLWETESVDSRESPVGQRLVGILRDFGLTNHNLWKEEDRK